MAFFYQITFFLLHITYRMLRAKEESFRRRMEVRPKTEVKLSQLDST